VFDKLDAGRPPAALVGHAEVERLVPLAAGATFDRALYTRDDAVVDVAALLASYVRGAVDAGVSVLTGETVRGIDVKGGAVRSICTDQLRIKTEAVVNAAGAWGTELARMAGGLDVPLRPTRRHLMLTPPLDGLDPNAPIVWDETHGLYFRTESGGLLLSPCDETDHPAREPLVDPSALELLAEKLERWMPRLADVSVRRTWSGLRTLTPDGCFVIGADPRIRGFFWCAGLGGHGVAASAAVGRMAAEAVTGGDAPAAHSPTRFAHASVDWSRCG
jgi:glycine/D-amino acid oxidase-like deaminating enzyme